MVPHRRLARRLRHPRSTSPSTLCRAGESRLADPRSPQVAVRADRLRRRPHTKPRRLPRHLQSRSAVPPSSTRRRTLVLRVRPRPDTPIPRSQALGHHRRHRTRRADKTRQAQHRPRRPARGTDPGHARTRTGRGTRTQHRRLPSPSRRRRSQQRPIALQQADEVFLIGTRVNQREAMRACFMHYGTTDDDVDQIVPAVLRAAKDLGSP